MRSKLDYTGWRENVDRYVWQIAGLSIDDLPDVSLRQWYDDGVSPQAAAKRAVRYAMEG